MGRKGSKCRNFQGAISGQGVLHWLPQNKNARQSCKKTFEDISWELSPTDRSRIRVHSRQTGRALLTFSPRPRRQPRHTGIINRCISIICPASSAETSSRESRFENSSFLGTRAIRS
jgi:hypothetical protein